MRIQGTFLGTKVARRMLFLFILCGIVPSSAAIGYAFVSVRSELRRHAQKQLKEQATVAAAAIMDQLLLLDRTLEGMAARVAAEEASDSLLREEPPEGFRDVGVQPWAPPRRGPGVMAAVPELWENSRRLSSGQSSLVVREEGLEARFFLGRVIDPSDPDAGLLWGELDPDVLWRNISSAARSALASSLCVFADSGQPLFCTLQDPESAYAQLSPLLQVGGDSFLWLQERNETLLAAHWALFLGFEFGAGSWSILASEPQAFVLAPLNRFQNYFALILVLAVATVFLLANIQIRRTTEPLDRLEEATDRVAHGDFDTEVFVESRDEFEDLANSFNSMTRRLQEQFATLAAMAAVDRAVLSSLDLDEIIEAVLLNAKEVTGCDGAGVLLVASGGRAVDAFLVAGDPPIINEVPGRAISAADLEALRSQPDGIAFHRAPGEPGKGRRAALTDFELFALAGLRHFWVFPLLEEETVYGALIIGHGLPDEFDSDARQRTRQLADQVSVALANVRLVSELNELSAGTITALARTIDAKSDWTAGHSGRVTNMALSLGDRLGLTAAERTALHRGGLLHDIGKIGIPPGILDKPGPLTDREREQMRQHPVIGARILEPIGALRATLPIVLHHHERFDGEGYPDGLAGEEIPRLARILAVADVFDALISHRPYRSALSVEEAVGIIREGAGHQFDPHVVQAFLELVNAEYLSGASIEAPAREAVG